MRKPFVWNEIEHSTGLDLMETIQLISEQDEADSFMEAYAEVCDDEDHAIQNVRYMLEIIGSDDDDPDAEKTAAELGELFGVEPTQPGEVISPMQWWSNSSYGVKEAAAA